MEVAPYITTPATETALADHGPFSRRHETGTLTDWSAEHVDEGN